MDDRRGRKGTCRDVGQVFRDDRPRKGTRVSRVIFFRSLPATGQIKALCEDASSPAEASFDAEREIAFGPHRSILCVYEDAGRTR